MGGTVAPDIEKQEVEVPDDIVKMDGIFYDPNGPHYVGVNLQVHYITNVDTVSQQFDTGMYLNFEYKPTEKDVEEYKRLKELGELENFTPEFQPAFRFPNMMETTQRDLQPYLDGSLYTLLIDGEVDTRGATVDLPSGSKYMIAARMAIRGTFAEPFELQNFPVDCQDLRIVITSTATSIRQVIVPHFRRNTFVTIQQDLTGLPEWTTHPPICDFILSDKAKSARGYQFSSVVLLMKVSRKSKSHVLRTASLIFFISASQLFAFAMEPDISELGNRLGIGFTLVLTALVFMFVVESRLPTVPYLTLLDKYIYGSFFLMIATMIGSTVVLKLHDAHQRKKWNAYVAYIAAGIILLFQIWFGFSLVYFKKQEQKKLTKNSFDHSEEPTPRPQLRVKSEKLYTFHHSFTGASLKED